MTIKEGRKLKKTQMKHTQNRWHKAKPKLPKKTSKDVVTKQKKWRRRKFGQRLNNKANGEESHDVQKDERVSLKISKLKRLNQVAKKVKHSRIDQEKETNVSDGLRFIDNIKTHKNRTNKQSDIPMTSLEFVQRQEEVIKNDLKEENDKIDYSGDISDKLKKSYDDVEGTNQNSSIISSPVSGEIAEKNLKIKEVSNKTHHKKAQNKRRKFIRYNLPSNKKNPRSKTRVDKSFKDLNAKNSVAEWLARG